ncbi:MAG: polysaccharide deacetylase family protein [Gemmatimonadaceae bacterium]
MRAILTYHSIDDSHSPISVAARAFRSQMEFLAAGRPRVLALADVASDAAPDECVALTFDDAFANFSKIAAPLLADLGLPATVFVVTDHVGGKNDWSGPGMSHGTVPPLPLMSWDEIERIARLGIEIGGHTRRHPRLSSLSGAELQDEIAGCAEKLRATLGARPASFAYPYGDVDDEVVAVVGRSYERACTTELRALEDGDPALRLPRLDAYYFRAAGLLEQWGSAAFQRRIWFRAQARRVRRFVASAAERG